MRPCACQAVRKARRMFEAAGLTTGEYTHMRLDTYVPDPMFPQQAAALSYCRELAVRWMAGERTGCLLFSAKPGTGKTHLAVGLLAEAVAQGRTVGFYSMASFFDDLLDSYGKKTTAELMDVLLLPDVVLLDDIGAEMRTGDMVQRTYYHVIDERLMQGRITLATTNLAAAQLAVVLGARVHSRLQALCPETVLLTGNDYRLKGNRNGR